MADRPRWSLIGRGLAGWHATAKSMTSDGGQLEPYTYWTGERCAGYAAEAEEGALVYDASKADAVAFVNLVVMGPMVDPGLDPHEVRKFDDHEALGRMLPALEGGYATVAAATLAGLCSLDCVGVGVYEHLLRKVNGIRIGRVHGGRVEWEAPHDLSATCENCGETLGQHRDSDSRCPPEVPEGTEVDHRSPWRETSFRRKEG